MDAKQIRVTVSGAPGVGKSAVIEFIARCLMVADIPAVFDPASLNVKEGKGLSTEEMNDRLESIKREGNRLVVLEEVDDRDAEALVKLLEIGSKQFAEGKHFSSEEMRTQLAERLKKKIQTNPAPAKS